MSGRERNFVGTRLFRNRKDEGAELDGVKDLPQLKNSEDGSVVFVRPPPKKEARTGETKRSNCWVTVIGVSPGCSQEVGAHFAQYGTIERIDEPPGNWVYIEFSTMDDVRRAVDSCRRGPQVMSGGMCVGCVEGRVRIQYASEEHDDIQERVPFEPATDDVIQPRARRGICDAIYDSIFG